MPITIWARELVVDGITQADCWAPQFVCRAREGETKTLAWRAHFAPLGSTFRALDFELALEEQEPQERANKQATVFHLAIHSLPLRVSGKKCRESVALILARSKISQTQEKFLRE